MAVRFLKSYGRYGVNEIAGFRPEHEAFLVEKEIAEVVPPPALALEEESMPETKDAPPPPKSKDAPVPPKTRQTTVGPQTRKA